MSAEGSYACWRGARLDARSRFLLFTCSSRRRLQPDYRFDPAAIGEVCRLQRDWGSYLFMPEIGATKGDRRNAARNGVHLQCYGVGDVISDLPDGEAARLAALKIVEPVP
jgi:hypothetical protein